AFRLRVRGLVVLVGERPRGGDPTVVLDLPEVLGTEAEQRRAVELRVAAHVIVLLGRELLVLPVAPFLVRRVLPAQEGRGRIPVVSLAREVAAPLEQQDALAGRGQLPRQRAPARARPDDDDVVVLGFGHGSTARGSSA